jgi:hypothetical protein
MRSWVLTLEALWIALLKDSLRRPFELDIVRPIFLLLQKKPNMQDIISLEENWMTQQ